MNYDGYAIMRSWLRRAAVAVLVVVLAIDATVVLLIWSLAP